MMSKRKLFAASACVCLLFSGTLAQAATAPVTQAPPIDEKLYTQYQDFSGGKEISISRCGATAAENGCFSSGTLSPFNRVCSIIDTPTTYVGKDETTHLVYILDGGVKTTDPVILYIYRLTDVITGFDSLTTKLVQKVSLPLKGGSNANCLMAANTPNIYVSTTLSTSYVTFNKANNTFKSSVVSEPSSPITQISTDDRGYVSVASSQGFYLFTPSGATEMDGGGFSSFFINSENGTTPH